MPRASSHDPFFDVLSPARTSSTSHALFLYTLAFTCEGEDFDYSSLDTHRSVFFIFHSPPSVFTGSVGVPSCIGGISATGRTGKEALYRLAFDVEV